VLLPTLNCLKRDRGGFRKPKDYRPLEVGIAIRTSCYIKDSIGCCWRGFESRAIQYSIFFNTNGNSAQSHDDDKVVLV
jgi:hypothetical protein